MLDFLLFYVSHIGFTDGIIQDAMGHSHLVQWAYLSLERPFSSSFPILHLIFLHGFMYKHLKNMVLNLFGPENLKTLLPGQMIFDLTAKKLISYDPAKSSENLRANFVAFMQGLISFHVDIPGTAYHKCLQVRKITAPKYLL